MERGKEKGMVVTRLMPQQNPPEELQAKFKEVENGFRAWLAKQSLPVDAIVVTTTSADIGLFMGTLTNDVSFSLPTPLQASLNPQAMASLKQAQVSYLFLTFVLIYNLDIFRIIISISQKKMFIVNSFYYNLTNNRVSNPSFSILLLQFIIFNLDEGLKSQFYICCYFFCFINSCVNANCVILGRARFLNCAR